jgi:hypothetical protein
MPLQISHAEITPAYTAPHSNWYDLESKHFHILHDKDDLAIAQKSLKVAEASYAVLSQFFKIAPEGKIYIGLANTFDYSNGFAMIAPRDATLINTMPPSSGALLSSSDWYENVILHELVHIFHLNQVTGIQKTLGRVFGKSGLFSPQNFQPTWILEGLATYLETSYIKNTRTASPYHENLMANEVQKGVRSFASINAGATHWPYGSDYLYGSYFFLFLEENYGQDSIKKMIHSYSDNNIPFRIVSNTIPATGKPLTVLWREYTQWLNQRFAYAKVKQKPLNSGGTNGDKGFGNAQQKILSHTAFISSPLSHNGKLYYTENDRLKHSRIIEQQANGIKRDLGKIQSGVLLDSHSTSGILLSQVSACSPSKVFSDLYILNPRSKHLKRITHCARYYNATWMADGKRIVAFKKHGSFSSMELLNKQGKHLRTLYKGAPGDNISWISVDGAKDNTHVLLIRKMGGNNRFALQEFNTNNQSWKTILNDTTVKTSARYAGSFINKDAKNNPSIIYTAQAQNTNTATEIFKLNKITKVRQQLSHFQGLAESPTLDSSNDTLYFIGTTPSGPTLFSINAQQQKINSRRRAKVSQKAVTKPKQLAFSLPKNVKATLKPYSALKSTLIPTGRYPLYLNTTAHKEIGLGLSGQDILFKHVWNAGLAYAPDLKTTTHAFRYTYDNKIAVSTNRAIEEHSYHDKDHTQLREYSLNTINTLEAQHSVDLVGARFSVGLGLADIHKQRLNKLKDSDDAVLKNTRHGLIGLNLRYNSASLFPDKLGLNDGRSLHFSLETYDVFRQNEDITGLVGQFHWGEYIALGKTTLGLKNSLAISRGGNKPALLKLGGSTSGNTSPSSRHIALNRRSFQLRGYANNAFVGTKLHTATLTWQIPIGAINKTASIPPIGLGKFGFNIFAETGKVWNKKSEDYKHAIGAELRGELKLGYRFTIPVNLGVAKGLDKKFGKVTPYLNFGASF